MRVAWSVLRPSRLNAPFGKLERRRTGYRASDKTEQSREEIHQQIGNGMISNIRRPAIAVLPFLKGPRRTRCGAQNLECGLL